MATRYYYILSEGKTRGPFPEKGILQLAAQGKLPPDAQLSEDGQTWTAAELILPSGSTRPAEPQGPSADRAVPSRPPPLKRARRGLPNVSIRPLNRQTVTIYAAAVVFGIVLILLAFVTARQVLIARNSGGHGVPPGTTEDEGDWASRGRSQEPSGWTPPPTQRPAKRTIAESGQAIANLRDPNLEAPAAGGGENVDQPSSRADSTDWLERVQLATVTILTDQGQGSGFFIRTASGDTLVVTNHHVVEEGTVVQVRFNDGTLREVSQAATYPQYDLAFLAVDGLERPPAVLPLRLESPRLTEKVFAYGAPLGFSGTVTEGIVSAVRTTAEIDQNLEDMGEAVTPYDHCRWIQTTAPISPGNSGGPLVDDQGRVVGVNTFSLSPPFRAQNLNFAVSAEQVIALLPQVRLESLPLNRSSQGANSRRRFPTGSESENATIRYWLNMKSALQVWLEVNSAMADLNRYPESDQIEILGRFAVSCSAMIDFLNELEDANVDAEAIQCKEAICQWMNVLVESLVSLVSDPENPLVAARVRGQLERTQSALAQAEQNARAALTRRYGVPFPGLLEGE